MLLIGTLGMSAQTISGTVTSLNGAGIGNYQVHIMNNDSMNPYSSSTYTIGSGAYSFSNLPTSATGYTVYVYDCQQNFVQQNVASNSGTANFSICTSNPSSCNAYFTSSPDSSNANLINFTDYSTGNPTTWAWSFGDGTTSNLQNPSHTYASSGSYNVYLLISSALCSDSISISVTVGNVTPSCAANFNSYPDSANANMIYFYDASTGTPTSWTWNFGDGTTSSLQNPVHTYSTQGNYTVSLSISSANCSDSYTQSITVGNGGNPSGCQAAYTFTANNLVASFTDVSTGSPTSWSWNFGDGGSSNLQNPSHTYSTAGSYVVGLTIFGNNCQSYIDTTISVSGTTPTNYSVSGSIMANNTPLTAGTVSLFNNSVVIATTSIDSNGGYSFYNVASGSYLVLATPSASVLSSFAATYYGDVIFWSTATTLTVNSNQTGININLVAIPATPGTGSISGNVGTGSKSSVENLKVYLTDDNNNNALVSSTLTDVSGDYNFANIADGTFKIWVEISGKTATPITVTLSNGSSNSSNNDFIVNSNTIVPKPTSITNNNIDGEIKLYPNPVTDVLNIEMNIEQTSVYDFNIYSISGQLIYTQQSTVNAGISLIRINTNNLPQGTYIIKMENTANQTMQKLFVK